MSEMGNTGEDMAGYVALLRSHWSAFCDADPVPDDFVELMDHAGLIQTRKVQKSDIDADDFAAERGIEMGGWLWELTPAGRAAIAKATGATP